MPPWGSRFVFTTMTSRLSLPVFTTEMRFFFFFYLSPTIKICLLGAVLQWAAADARGQLKTFAAPTRGSLKSMALAYPSTGSQYHFFGISQASSGNFQPDFVFSCCLIKDTEKLFSPPAAFFRGSKMNSAKM